MPRKPHKRKDQGSQSAENYKTEQTPYRRWRGLYPHHFVSV